MLPDFPKLKRLVNKHFHRQLRADANRASGPLALAQKVSLWEANRTRVMAPDGTFEDTPLHHGEVTFTYTHEELDTLPQDEILKRVYGAVSELGSQRDKVILDVLDKAASGTGLVFKGDGPPNALSILDALEKLIIDFDENNQPYYPELFINNRIYKNPITLFPELDTDPALKDRLKAILAKKYEDFRDRETNRALVG